MGQGFEQISGMGMAGARIAGGDFFPPRTDWPPWCLVHLACQWAEPSLVHPTPLTTSFYLQGVKM